MASCNSRRVSLELLRPGPAHNFLLSPLTNYLGIAAQGTAEVINIPYEHGEFIRRLAALRYPFSALEEPTDARQAQLFRQRRREAELERQATLLELSSKLTAALCRVPGLGSQLSRRGCDGGELVHLEMVVSAGELSMLPFELLGILEQGPPDPGRFLLLAGNPPVCLTRRVRSVVGDCVRWGRPPRILFVTAAPGLRSVPVDEHQKALQMALAPWVIFDSERPEPFLEALKQHLTVIENATIAQIAEACAKEEYTHVHILAHGEPLPASPGGGFGIALHSQANSASAHIVTGDQLASALQRDGGRAGPTVVSLAMCDGGTVSDLTFTGASFAHELHRTGVPFVVASQFPLAFSGSTVMTEMLYRGLLRGDDPRQTLVDLRTRLHALYAGESHDWASLVVYAALPADLDAQIERFRYERTRAQLEAALKHADDVVRRSPQRSVRIEQLVEEAQNRLPAEGQYTGEALGLRAAAAKRLAFSYFNAAEASTAPVESASLFRKSFDGLRTALRQYEEAARMVLLHQKGVTAQYAALHWTLTQALSLGFLLTGAFDEKSLAAARLSASTDAQYGQTREAVVWGYASLLELQLLRAWFGGATGPFRELEDAVGDFIARTTVGEFPIESTLRQVRRYLDWWWSPRFRSSAGVDASQLGAAPTEQLVAEVTRIAKRLVDHR